MDFKRILKSLLPMKFFVVIFSLCRLVTNMYLIFLIQRLIDNITKNTDGAMLFFKSEIYKYFFVLPMFLGFVVLSSYYYSKLINKGEFLIKSNLFKSLVFRKELLNVDSGVVSSQFLTDVKIISKWKTIGATTIIIQTIQFFVPFCFMLYYSPILTIALPILILICYGLQSLISKSIAINTQKLQYNIAGVNQYVITTLNSFKTILQLNKNKYFSDKFNSLQKENVYNVELKISLAHSFFVMSYVALNNIIPFFILGIGFYLIILNMMTIGKLIAIYTLISYLTEPIIVVSDLINQRKVSNNLIENIKYMFDYQNNDNGVKELECFEKLKIDSKYFMYGENSDKKILENLNFEINKKDIVKIDGMSGRGKTTLINLISRFIKSNTVLIKYNNVDIQEIDIDKYYEKVVQVEQQPIMIEDTVYENIVLGDSYSQSDIDEVVEVCCLGEFIKTKKMDFVITEGSKNISGGEKQRINLARMLIRKPQLLILDEPTASLNRDMAKELVKNLKNFVDKYSITLVVISHNDDFDSIINKNIDLNVL